MKIIMSILILFGLGVASMAHTPFSSYNESLARRAEYAFVLPQEEVIVTIPGTKKPTATSKSRGKAMLMSLIVPGLGQYYTEAKTKATVFLGVEIGLWLTYGGLTAYGNWRQNDYETYAATHAGVNLDGKNNTFLSKVQLVKQRR